MMESQVCEYKSLKKIKSGDTGIKELAKTCVCLANAQGGSVFIGYEDTTGEPPLNQYVTQKDINDTLKKLRGNFYGVSISASEVITHNNGSQFFIINVLPSAKIVATTADGKIYIRSGEECLPIRSEDVTRLAIEKDAFQWELVKRPFKLGDANPNEVYEFLSDIRRSRHVRESVKSLTDDEILEHYHLVDGHQLTNLGALWLGTSFIRARLSYPITVQYIVYDEREEKIRKVIWNDYHFNPKRLILEIEKEAKELQYFHEFPSGLYRRAIRFYPQEVIRELLVNAFAHKSYTISADIFIEVYPDRFRISNPGGLPLGVTKNNILHQKHRRNPHVINIFQAIGLMEGEGSGYDLIYEKLSKDLKPFPIIETDFNEVSVTVKADITDNESISVLDYVLQYFPDLSRKEVIALGAIARYKKMLGTELSKELQLNDDDRLRNWVVGLLNRKILILRGHKKGAAYLINPDLLSSAKLNVKPTLKTIETHVLKALIIEDLRININSKISDIANRLEDVPLREIRNCVYQMVEDNELVREGSKKLSTYSLAKKK